MRYRYEVYKDSNGGNGMILLKRWMLQPVRLCKNGCIRERVAPAIY